MEIVVHCQSLEQARNQAIDRFRREGGVGGPYTKVVIAKNMHGDSPLAGARVGVEYSKPWLRLRLDFDSTKGPHYNVETRTTSYAFTFTDVVGGVPFEEMSPEEQDGIREWMWRIGARLGSRRRR